MEGFTMVKNDFIFGSELAPPAFRIALYLAAKPDNWIVRQADIRKHCQGIGQDAYFKAIGQLVDGGYLHRGSNFRDGRTPPVITKKLDGAVRWPARVGTQEDGAIALPQVRANSVNPSWDIPVGERRELQRTDSTNTGNSSNREIRVGLSDQTGAGAPTNGSLVPGSHAKSPGNPHPLPDGSEPSGERSAKPAAVPCSYTHATFGDCGRDSVPGDPNGLCADHRRYRDMSDAAKRDAA